MQHFKWTQFSKRIYINASINKVYDAWTKSEKLETWFLSEANFYSLGNQKINANQNVAAGNNYEWTWFAQNQTEKGTVINCNGFDFFEFTFAGNCKVQVRLSSEKKQTLVTLTQNEIPTDEQSKENIRLGCAFGWAFYLVNLKSVLEGGLDLRNKDTALTNVVNN